MKTICLMGLGYIGLPTAVMFASTGRYRVIGVDINGHTVETIRQGKTHIHEPDLDEKVAHCIAGGKLTAQETPTHADVFILAVPTPITPGKKADLSFVEASARAITPFLRKGNLVILESTVPPRTTLDILLPILAESGLKTGTDLLVSHCPERVLPGKICHEMVHNNRIIGGINGLSTQVTRDLYASFVKGELYLTDATSAELAKLMENTYRDVNIALANEFARIGNRLGINVWEAIAMANKHPRVNLHLPGPGVGGHCIAVDPWFIVEKAPEEARLIRLSRTINDMMPQYVVKRIFQHVADIPAPCITLLGLSYKANVGDCRESPSLKVAKLLLELGFQIRCFDPLVQGYDYSFPTVEEAVTGSDLLVLLVGHDSFRSLDPLSIKPLMRNPALLDTRNMLPGEKWEEAGYCLVPF